MEWLIGIFALGAIGHILEKISSSGGSEAGTEANAEKAKAKSRDRKSERDLELEKLRKSLLTDLRRPAATALSDKKRVTENLEKKHLIVAESSIHVVKSSKKRTDEIKSIVSNRKIEFLLHFTPITNIPEILRYGLLGRVAIQEKKVSSTWNDDHRFDHLPNALCLSISFPNYQLFYRFRMQKPALNWAVLKLSPAILWELDCAFCSSNAANSMSSSVSLNERRKPQALAAMFEDYPEPCCRSNLRLPESFPTCPQAEVLVMESVSTKFIEAIYVNEEKTLDSLSRQLDTMEDIFPRKNIYFNDCFFRPREDYSFWKRAQPPSNTPFQVPSF